MNARMAAVLCCLFTLTGQTTSLQAQYTVSDFLLTAFEDVNLDEYSSQIGFISPGNVRLPVIDEVEIRLKNDERTYEDLRYQLRVSPANPWKIRRNQALFNATKAGLDAKKQLQIKENLFTRYEVVLEYFEQLTLAEIHKKALNLANRKTEILQNNTESTFFDARDFAESKLEQIEVLEEYTQTEVELSYSRQKIMLEMGITTLDWARFRLITIPTIDSLATQISAAQFSSTELDVLAKQYDIAQKETMLEKSDFDIGYLQAEYTPFLNQDGKNELGFSVGISLPIFKKNKPRIAERMLQQIEREHELIAETSRDSIQKALEYSFLLSLIKQHQHLEANIAKLNIATLRKNLAIIEEKDPLVLTELEAASLKLEELRIKSKFRVLEQYLYFLFAFDAPVRLPLRNYLSEELQLLE